MFDKHYLAIEISNSAIKLAYGNYNNSKLVIKEFSIIPTPQASMNNGSIIKPELIFHSIQEEINRKELSGNRIIFVISSSNSITREIQLPKSTPKEVELILKNEAQQFFPMDLKDYVFDHKILEDVVTKAGTFTRVLLVALPIKLADEYMKLGQMLNIKVEAIEIPISCIYKLVIDAGQNEVLQLEETDSEQNFVIMDIGQSATNVGIFSKKAFKNTRLVQGGCNEIINAINTSLENSITKPEPFIFEDLDLLADKTWYFKTAKNAIDNMFFSVSRFIEFYLTNTFGVLSKVYLVGGGSKIKGINDYVSKYFGISTKSLESGKGLVYKGKVSQDEFRKAFPLLVNVFGALVR